MLFNKFKKSVPASSAVQVVPHNNLNSILEVSPSHVSWGNSLRHSLLKTRNNFGKKILGLFNGGKIDADIYNQLETILLTADVGVTVTHNILEHLRQEVRIKDLANKQELQNILNNYLLQLLSIVEPKHQQINSKPHVIMLVGINGAGKTTSIGKLAKYFQTDGKSVMLAAGDTFRAAAKEQLLAWGVQNNIPVISSQGGDAAAVCFDAIKSATAQKIDIVIIDTAGRLTTQVNLMEEIKKIKRVIGRALDGAPHETLLVLDANVGQNALTQVRAFDEAIGVSGLIITKLDGTAKGGMICAIANDRPIPVKFIGVGEAIDDLKPFVAKDYIAAIISE